jgi:hypothetical protein
MKVRPALMLTLCLSICFFLANPSKGEPVKHALIIAIGNYPAESSWPSIGSMNDIPLIVSALEKQGFDKKEITILKDREATRQGIRRAFLDLSNKISAGDVLFIHFSGHGQQIRDDNGDESDGLDESLIPYDAFKYFKTGSYEGEHHLRDDEVKELLDILREKLGEWGSVMVSLDACHSGTGTRGWSKARGTDEVFNQQGRPVNPTVTTEEELAQKRSGDGLAPIVIFSASGAFELNYEYEVSPGISVGPLSFALSKCLSAARTDMTCRNLFHEVQGVMAFYSQQQTPQLEGDAGNQLFGGNMVGQPAYFNVSQWLDDTTGVVSAGLLAGWSEGSGVGLYETGTGDPAALAPIASGTVIRSNLLESTVRFSAPVENEPAGKGNLFLLTRDYSVNKLNLLIDTSVNPALRERLNASLEGLNLLSYSTPPYDVRIVTDSSDNRSIFRVISVRDQVLFEAATDTCGIAFLAGQSILVLKKAAQAKLLRSLEVADDEVNLSLKLVDRLLKPIEQESAGSTQTSLSVADTFRIMVYNNGQKRAWFSLIDLQPDNVVNVIYPNRKTLEEFSVGPQDCMVRPGDSLLLKTEFVVGPPRGQEMMILVGARNPVDLEFMSSENSSKGSYNPFELLYAESSGQMITRGALSRIPRSAVSIYKVVFEIR